MVHKKTSTNCVIVYLDRTYSTTLMLPLSNNINVAPSGVTKCTIENLVDKEESLISSVPLSSVTPTKSHFEFPANENQPQLFADFTSPKNIMEISLIADKIASVTVELRDPSNNLIQKEDVNVDKVNLFI